VLNGVGIRSKFWISLYAVGLYLETKSSDAKKILEEDTPIMVSLTVISSMISA